MRLAERFCLHLAHQAMHLGRRHIDGRVNVRQAVRSRDVVRLRLVHALRKGSLFDTLRRLHWVRRLRTADRLVKLTNEYLRHWCSPRRGIHDVVQRIELGAE